MDKLLNELISQRCFPFQQLLILEVTKELVGNVSCFSLYSYVCTLVSNDDVLNSGLCNFSGLCGKMAKYARARKNV